MSEQQPPATPGFTDGASDSSDSIDVSRIHLRIVSREEGEPEEGREPTPWWLWTFSVVLLFGMGVYIGRYGGSFSSAAHEVEEPQTTGAQAPPVEVKGDLVFAGVCQACHQFNGLGVAGQYPPLAGSEWLTGPREVPIRIVLHGLAGSITVKGATFNNRMPPFQDKLTNEEIAAAITYARSSWGNASSAVSAAIVDSLRMLDGPREQWSAQELAAKANLRLP